MESIAPSNHDTSRSLSFIRRQFVLGLMLLGAVGLASVSLYRNQLASVPDPRIVFRTDAEAVEGARQFLAEAHVITNGFDFSAASGITIERSKGWKVWQITWSSKQGIAPTNRLMVAAYETGYFVTCAMSSTNANPDTLIDGYLNGFVPKLIESK